MERKCTGKLVDIYNKGRVSVASFDLNGEIVSASMFNDGMLPDLVHGMEYRFTIVSVEKDGKTYLNLKAKWRDGQKVGYDIEPTGKADPKLDFMPASMLANSKPVNWQVKDARITRMSCISSASTVVAALARQGEVKAGTAGKVVLELAGTLESWVLRGD